MESSASPTPRRERYHHGDLRAAIIGSALELIAERGVRGFSLAEAARRVGVAGSAPYRHFADRDALLAAVAVIGAEQITAYLQNAVDPTVSAENNLTRLVRAYVVFASEHRALFEALVAMGRMKADKPELATTVAPIAGATSTSLWR